MPSSHNSKQRTAQAAVHNKYCEKSDAMAKWGTGTSATPEADWYFSYSQMLFEMYVKYNPLDSVNNKLEIDKVLGAPTEKAFLHYLTKLEKG